MTPQQLSDEEREAMNERDHEYDDEARLAGLDQQGIVERLAAKGADLNIPDDEDEYDQQRRVEAESQAREP